MFKKQRPIPFHRDRLLPRLRDELLPCRSAWLLEPRVRNEFESFFPRPGALEGLPFLPSALLPFCSPLNRPPLRRFRACLRLESDFSRTVNTGSCLVGGGVPSGRASVARISGRRTESAFTCTGSPTSGGSGLTGTTTTGSAETDPCKMFPTFFASPSSASALERAPTSLVWRREGTRAALYGCSVSHVLHLVNLISSPTSATTTWLVRRRSRGQ